MSPKLRVLIVDDSAFFRRRIAEMLGKDAGIEIVGVAVNGSEAVALNRQLKPDVITMDVEMPVMDGIEA
ncbi:MAG: response regulator, partial [Candidatus Sedimenticola sp. 6PFRAG5]